MPCKPELRVSATPDALFHAAATEFATVASQAVKARGTFYVALSGGSTPKALYSVLARDFKESIPWQKVFFFFGDERNVTPDDPDSNYRMANEALLSKVPAQAENVFRIRGELEAAEAARDYERIVRSIFNLQINQVPRFDLILLGLGPDGHTASLFPSTAALNESRRLVVENWVEKFKTHRITFTFPVLNHARVVIFLVSGGDKASMVREVLETKNANLPSQRVCPESGKLLWLVDRAAAALVSGEHAHP